ncbi:hypothetical protein [Treponema denticola]|nr:hypothetical protein [Treponema denticola]UTC83944.1 hypothetical protein HGJ18_12380 [Treponema denticola]UTY27303.1 hypothetical protein E4N77_12345 [Treponema denticola]
MKALLRFIKSNRKSGNPQRSETLTPQEKIQDQAIVWKANVGKNYFTI